MTAKNFPTVRKLIEKAEVPRPPGVTGFNYSNEELQALLPELSKRVAIGVHDVKNLGPGDVGMQITVYLTLSRDELDAI